MAPSARHSSSCSPKLFKFSIKKIIELPVSQHLNDHGSINIVWKFKNPENGHAFGSPAFNKPEYTPRNSMDWIAIAAAPDDDPQKATTADKTTFTPGPRSDYKITVMYAVMAAPPDGTHITAGVLCIFPTHPRGTLTFVWNSNSATANPTLNPRYSTTAHDRAVIRAGMRRALQTMESPPSNNYIENETSLPGMPRITSASSNVQLDARANAISRSWFHAAGTANMGKVVDSECRVYGVCGLRVVDAGVLARSLAAYL